MKNMNGRYTYVVISLIIGVLTGVTPRIHAAEQKSLNVVFFNPAKYDDIWWANASKIMQAACDDLDMSLMILYAERSQYEMVKQFKHVVSNSKKPDAAVFQSLKTNGLKMLTEAESAGIKSIMFNAGLPSKNAEQYGGPRENFISWVGQMLPDDERAGYDLARVLFEQARQKGLEDASGKVHVLGLDGTMSDFAALERHKGLLRAVKEDGQVVLHQTSPGYWERERGKRLSMALRKRYPDANVVWAANDPMGLGVIDGLKENGLIPGKDVLVGSIDWIPEALEAIQAGELTVSIGGHFMESAWVIILLYDYFNGRDFAEETVDFKSTMGILTQENIEIYLQHLGAGQWENVDFRQFSKILNPQLTHYDFTFEAVLKQLIP